MEPFNWDECKAFFVREARADEADAQFPTAKPSPQEAFIGRGYVQPFLGAMDDVRIYKRALSSEEVANLYKAMRNPTGP